MNVHPVGAWLGKAALYQQRADVSSANAQESTLLRLAERQAGREEELLGVRQKVAELEAELSDLQREVELRQEQEQALKEVCISCCRVVSILQCL